MRYIPNIFTLTHLVLGCLAVLYTFYDKLYISAILIFVASVIDFLDGFVARLLNAQSEIGKQLDSLADLTTFGIAPGFILYHLLAATFQQQPHSLELPIAYFLPAFLVPVFSALRLAKFNIDERQRDYFIGLPTPACALFIASLPLILFSTDYVPILNLYFLYPVIIILSYLLVSPLPMFSLKFKHFRWQSNQVRYFFLMSSLILVVILRVYSIPLIVILYVIFSVANKLTTRANSTK